MAMKLDSTVQDLIRTIQNSIAVYIEEGEDSEYDECPEVVPKLAMACDVLKPMVPVLAVLGDFLTGEITPKMFMRRWAGVEKQLGAYEVTEIEPPVVDFIKRAGRNDEGEAA